MLAFAAVVSAIAGLAVAVVPAWRTARRDVQEVLRAGGGTTTGGLRIRSVLLSVQVALAVTLLVVTALLTMSFTRLLRSERGFSPEGVVAADVSMPPGRYSDPDKLTAGYRPAPRTCPGDSRDLLSGVGVGAAAVGRELGGRHSGRWRHAAVYTDADSNFASSALITSGRWAWR